MLNNPQQAKCPCEGTGYIANANGRTNHPCSTHALIEAQGAKKECPRCSGTGKNPDDSVLGYPGEPCYYCYGTGIRADISGLMKLPFTCPNCGKDFGWGDGAAPIFLGVVNSLPFDNQPTPCCGYVISGTINRKLEMTITAAKPVAKQQENDK